MARCRPKGLRAFRLDYRPEDIQRCLRAVGLEGGDTVYVISALSRLPGLEGFAAIADTSAVFYEALRSIVTDEGTIVAPTSSQNLCNTDIVFDPVSTPSFERGLFPEYLRVLPGQNAAFIHSHPTLPWDLRPAVLPKT